jgi:pimeloyl-ACP methyl ester carboxylesterase
MDARDVCAIGDALAEGLDGTAKKVEEMGDAVVRRSFGVVGPARAVPEAVYNQIGPRVFGSVRKVGPAAIRSGALGLGATIGPDRERIDSSRRGKAVVSAVNALLGDALARRGNSLAVRMTLRTTAPEAFPPHRTAAPARIVVFVHGFGESDDSWTWYSDDHWGAAGLSYGELLRRELDFVPLYLHYNSGRALGVNALELSALIEDVVALSPGWVGEIVLVGHSAGAQLAVSALRHARLSGARWAAVTTHVFALGNPRAARIAEHTAQRASEVLGRLPETRPLADLLETRSAGLKDLADEADPPASPDVRLVQLTTESTGVGHFRLLNHPAVYNEMKARLSVRTVLDPARAAREGRYGRAAMALRARRLSRRRSR